MGYDIGTGEAPAPDIAICSDPNNPDTYEPGDQDDTDMVQNDS